MAFWEVVGTLVNNSTGNKVEFRTFVSAEELVNTVNEAIDALIDIETPVDDDSEGDDSCSRCPDSDACSMAAIMEAARVNGQAIR